VVIYIPTTKGAMASLILAYLYVNSQLMVQYCFTLIMFFV
jgi:hypothetical protein